MDVMVSSDAAMLEQLIRQVRGVVGARVVGHPPDAIDEIHVVGTPDRQPKAVVRDIESIVYVRTGLRLNHRKISLVQLPETQLFSQQERVRLVRVEQAPAQTTVTLAFGTTQFSGQSAGGETEAMAVARRTAEATLEAVEQMIGEAGQFAIEATEQRSIGGSNIWMSLLSRNDGDAAEQMVGVSIVRGPDVSGAAARSVLDAVNRRLTVLLHRP
jgi:hypothetical protein